MGKDQRSPALGEPGTVLKLLSWISKERFIIRKYKMIEPSYQELVSSEIPSANTDGVTVKIIAGRSMGIESPVRTRTPTSYLDFKFSPKATFTQEVSKSWTCFVYILEGKFRFNGSKEIEAHNTVLFNNDGEGVQMENIGSTEGHLVLIAGEPISKNFVFKNGKSISRILKREKFEVI